MVAGAAAFLETVPGVGVFFPGEAVLAGAAATIDGTPRHYLGVTVVLAAWTGDQVNFWIARLSTRHLRLAGKAAPSARRSVRAFQGAMALLRAHGVWAVLVGRLIPVVRSFIPAAAGVARIPPVPFALASAVGCVLWASLWLGAGSVLRAALDQHPAVVALVVVGATGCGLGALIHRLRGQPAG